MAGRSEARKKVHRHFQSMYEQEKTGQKKKRSSRNRRHDKDGDTLPKSNRPAEADYMFTVSPAAEALALPYVDPRKKRDEDSAEAAKLRADKMASKEKRPFRWCFGFGYMSNSFFAKRLAFVSFLILAIDSAGLVFFYSDYMEVKTNGIGGDNVEPTAGCKNTTEFSLLVYHYALINVVLGLPSTGIRLFDIFSRAASKNMEHRQKVKRTLFLQFCELVAVMTVLYLVVLTIYLLYTLYENAFRCDVLEIWVFAFFSISVYILIFVQITYFSRFREHLKMQLGVFKEKDQTGNIRSRYKLKKRLLQSVESAVTADIRKRLYTAVELRDIGDIETVLGEAQHRLGTDFVDEMYESPAIWLGLFSKSVKNPMHLAAYMGDISALKLLRSAGFDINAFDKVFRVRFSTGDLFWFFMQYVVKRQASEAEGTTSISKTTLLTPLHCATASGRVEAVRWLIGQGAKVNAVAKSSSRHERLPPIFFAEHPVIVEDLLQAGANHLAIPDPGSMNTLTALELAYIKENFGVAQVLEEWGGDTALTPLHAAAACNDTSKALGLLKTGADPDCLGEHGYVGLNRRTPLHWAATMGCQDTVNILLKYKADPNFSDRFGRTALHWAMRRNEKEIVRLLLEWGADPSWPDCQEETPIVTAASAHHIDKDLFLLLVNHGADINYQLPNGDTAMHVAMKKENRGTALSLLECGANIMVTNREGFRPLDCTTSTELQFVIKKAAGNRDVMISYTHSHTEFATKLRQTLEQANITTWLDIMDPTGIGGGSVWREEIARGISNAAVVLCILTEDYPKSEWCLKELAYAKQVGTPVIGVSCENVQINEELQVYLYTRQMVPFEPAITAVNKEDRRNIRYEYDDYKYSSQFRFLLDGIRDEIEKRRQAGIDRASLNRADHALSIFPEDGQIEGRFVFLSHGNCHIDFVRKVYEEFRSRGVMCFMDQTGRSGDMAQRINDAKDAILKCDCFVVFLSDITATNELVNDQLAFAEDKGKPILPILLSDPQMGLGQQYTLSRNRIYHFTSHIGFSSSFKALMKGVQRHIDDRPGHDKYRLSRVSALYSGVGTIRSSRVSGFESPLALSFASSSSEVIRI